MPSKPIHLVCSSGGVKCFSYIGAIKLLEERGYEIKSVSASSMGSFIGIMACAGLDAAKMEEKVLQFRIKEYVRKRYWLKWWGLLKFPFALYHTPDFEKILTDITGSNQTLGELTIPYATMALDLRQRQLLIYSSATHPGMTCAEVLTIATAIPPMYAPFSTDKRLLVDAGVATESPAWVTAGLSGDEPIIVLKSANAADEKYLRSFNAFIENMVSSAAASNDNFSLEQIDNALRVEINCGDQKAEDFSITPLKIEKLILQGYEAMRQKLNELDNNLNNRLQVKNLASVYTGANNTEQAAVNSAVIHKKFSQAAAKRNLVFISYSHKDEAWFNKIKRFLQPMEHFIQINVWDDTEILPGQKWREAIKDALAATKVAVCIVTQNFPNSEFITKDELSYFIEVTEKENVPIFWIAASSSTVNLTPLNEIQCAHNPALPLDMLPDAEQNATITAICNKLAAAMKR